jgi:predicted acetyltransferase
VVEIDRRRGEGPILCDEAETAGIPREKLLPAASVVCAGAMGRIVDVTAALALHPGPSSRRIKAHIGLDLSDPVFAAQSRPFDVTFEQKTTSVIGGREARERLALGVDRLAQIYFGGATATSLRDAGIIAGSERAAAVLDDVLGGSPCFLSRPNFF